MKMLKKGWYLVFLLALVLVLSACADDGAADGGSKEPTPKDKDGDTSEKSTEVQEITIGYSGPLSGPAATYGNEALNGIKIAAEEINEEGNFIVDGVTYKVKIASLDDQYLPNETAANAKRLVQEEKTKFIYAPHSGGIYAMQVFNEQEDFIIMGYSSEPGMTEQGNELTVRIPPRYDDYLEPFTTYQMERFGKKIAFLPTNSQYGKDWAEALKPAWEEHGGEVVFNESIDFSKDTDFQTIMANALNKKPDVLFIGGPSEPTALVAKQARDLGFEGGFIVMDQAKLDEMAIVLGNDYDSLEGAIGTTPLIYTKYPATESFVERYNEKYKKNPGSEVGLNYISLHVLTDAMKIAGTVDDTKAIMASLDESVKNQAEDKQVYIMAGVGDDGGFEPRLNVSAVEDGKVEVLAK